MPSIDRRVDRELKKGSAELIVLSIFEARARHSYEVSKLIEARSNGHLKFHVASLYPLLYRLEERGWLHGRWVEKAGQRRRRFYGLTRPGAGCSKVSGARGKPSSRRWGSSPESTMPDHATGSWPRAGPGPDWGQDLRAHLGELRLTHAREAEIVAELSQHLDDRYADMPSFAPPWRWEPMPAASCGSPARHSGQFALGLALGMAGAAASATVLPAMPVGTGGAKRLSILVMAVVLVAVGVAASAVPARRAPRLDPTTALQAE